MKARDLDAREVDVPRLLLALCIPHERRGSQLVGCCPFHEDSKPSWAIRDEQGEHRNGRHRCLACGEGGDIVKLVMHVLGLSYAGAIEWIVGSGIVVQAAAEGLELRMVDSLAERAPREVRMPLGFRTAPLDRWPQSPRRYAEKRGIDAVQVERWGVGYAVDGVLEGRLVFPVRDTTGALRSYEARAYAGRSPKYLRPSVADGFRFGAIFGAERWGEPGSDEVVVLTEGVLNALACERAGAPAVAAICGSVLSGEHLLEIAPRFKRVVVATDPDKAGSRIAAEFYASLARWRDARVAALPPGKDCADLDAGTLAGILWRA